MDYSWHKKVQEALSERGIIPYLRLSEVDDICMLLRRYASRCDNKGGSPKLSENWRELANRLENIPMDEGITAREMIENIKKGVK